MSAHRDEADEQRARIEAADARQRAVDQLEVEWFDDRFVPDREHDATRVLVRFTCVASVASLVILLAGHVAPAVIAGLAFGLLGFMVLAIGVRATRKLRVRECRHVDSSR